VKKIIFSTLISFSTLCVFAQNAPQPKKSSKKDEKKQQLNAMQKVEDQENDLIFNKHSIFGFKIATDGWGLSYEKGKFNTRRRSTLYQFEFNEKKLPKEYKLTSGNAFFSQNELIYGKENNFYQLKFGLGQQILLGTKGNKNGVHVSFIGAGGFSAGLQKPYVVDVANTNTNQRFQSTYPTIIDSGYAEIGAAGFTKGWSQVKLVPGAHIKTAMRFDYGKFNEVIGAIEAGVNLEYYFKAVQQMTYNKDKNLLFNAYISILFGKRK
jgi:hypothetical protein